MLIYLTGFMGAGKTSVGKRLAEALDLAFVDLDGEVERLTGASIASLFAQRGEGEFRRAESAALAACSKGADAVVATGGGIVEDERNIETMRSTGRLVFLDAPFEMLARRAAADPVERPLFRDLESARRRYELRLPLYQNCDLHIRIEEGEPPEAIAREICRLLEEACAT